MDAQLFEALLKARGIDTHGGAGTRSGRRA